ncbi:right-handed parallel beta-helix repeat-containing protein [Paenibacillus sepulcri]
MNVITDFNAVGDGIHDDTLAIQTAINSVPEGGTLLVPAGNYKVSKNPLHKITTGYGTSYAALKIVKPITIIMNDAIFETKTADSYGAFWVYKASNVHFQGGSLRGDQLPSNGILTSRVGLLLQDCRSCSVEGMTIRNYSQGINVYNSEDCSISRIISEYNNGSGIISFNSDRCLIDSCQIRNSRDGHLSLFGGGQYNTVSNCTVTEDRDGNLNQQGITLEREINSVIKNNTVRGFYYGIDVKNGSDSCILLENQCTNNQFNIAIRPGDDGNNLQATSNNITISKNDVTSPRRLGPSAGILVKVGSGHVISENIINKNMLILIGGVRINNNLSLNQIKIINNRFIS